MTKMKTKFKVGDRCKCLHPYAYRREEPFIIVGICNKFLSSNGIIRAAYVIQYDDGKYDAIPIENEGGYEMRPLREGV